MAECVNLDSLIPREDFEVRTDGDETPIQQTIQIRDLESSAFFFGALRKPDFQRETAEWQPARVGGLVRSFIENDLIPAVILWKNHDLVFVIDGSHRLSALIAWVQDDYGDGPRSQEFFDHTVPEEQVRVAKRTREAVEGEIGAYEDHRRAIENPDQFGPDIVARARRLGSLALQLQWVRGDSQKAEDSFIRINQQAAMITPQELELIKSRRKPNAIAARAIIRRGTGHKYWSAFSAKTQREIKELATNIYELVFEPKLRYPIKSIDLPAGGAEYSSTALRMVYDLVNLSVGVTAPDDDRNGRRTVNYLKRTRRVMRLLLSNHASSLGLHPAVYFYSWTGKQQPILLLVMVELIIDLERRKRLPEFIKFRKEFETFLIDNRTLLNQVIRKYGTKDSGRKHLRKFYDFTMAKLVEGASAADVVTHLTEESLYSFLQPGESPYSGVSPTRYSTQVKSGIIIHELLPKVHRCNICGGLVPAQAISIDHKKRREDGGASTVKNAQVTHPFCNTGIKN